MPQKVPGNTWYVPRVRYRMPESKELPALKPEALRERIILAGSNAGDVVLDPFGGTFPTGAVAPRLGRPTVGIESQAEFIEIGLHRPSLADYYEGERFAVPEKTYQRAEGRLL